jgi:hypothetical protein
MAGSLIGYDLLFQSAGHPLKQRKVPLSAGLFARKQIISNKLIGQIVEGAGESFKEWRNCH